MRPDILSLEGKVAFVTGCGTVGDAVGNGKAIAILLARRGAKVFGIDLRSDAADSTRSLIQSEGNTIETAIGDVTKPDFVKSALNACVEKFGRLDIVVNNVGASEPGDPVTMSDETWTNQINLNLTTAFSVCKFAIPVMEAAGGGAIVNISSVAGLRYIGKPQVAYSAAKAALMQMTKTTAVIYARRGIRLNCVVPGLIDTPLVTRLAEKYFDGKVDEFRQKRNAQVPMGFMGSAWDVANAALFLASDEARYITGTEIVVDGGFIAATQ